MGMAFRLTLYNNSYTFYFAQHILESLAMSYEAIGDNGKQNGTSSSPAYRSSSASVASMASKASSRLLRQRTTPEPLAEPLTATGIDAEDEAADPYYVFRGDLFQKLDLVDESLAEYLRVIHQTDTAVNTAEVRETKKQLKRHIKNAESTLRDVQTTVQLVENDREKFSHIDDKELYERKSLVQTSGDRLSRAKQESHSEAVKAKMLADERAKAVRRAGAESLGAKTDAERQNTNFIVDSQARTSLLVQHQDETLDELDAAVTRVGVMAEGIHDEVGQQNKMLTEMEQDLENVEEELGVVMGKLAKFLQTKDRWQLGTILMLSFIVIVLLILVLYT